MGMLNLSHHHRGLMSMKKVFRHALYVQEGLKIPLVSERIGGGGLLPVQLGLIYLLGQKESPTAFLVVKKKSVNTPFQPEVQRSSLSYHVGGKSSRMNLGPPYVTLLSTETTYIRGQSHAVYKESCCKNRTGVLASPLK